MKLPDTVRVAMHRLMTDNSLSIAERKYKFDRTFKIDGDLVDDITDYYKYITIIFDESKVLFFLQILLQAYLHNL